MSASANNKVKPDAKPRRGRGQPLQWLVFAAMIAFVSLSLADVFLIPPGEGFDELAHYSYVSLLADEGRIPVIGQDSIDASWEERRTNFPEPYDALGERMTYRAFFEQPDDARREAFSVWYGRPDEPIRFQQGTGSNWQGQHPPLYYLAMVPVYKLSAGLSIGYRLLWMRLVTVIIACSSVVFFWLAWRAAATETQRRLALGVALAALMPSLVLDVARLGNDSLSMALAAALFWQLLALRTSRRPWLTVTIIGLLLGLGCLTKALFTAFAPGVIITVALIGRHRARWRTVLVQFALVVLICVAIAGWWHLRSYRLYGLWLATNDALTYGTLPRVALSTFAFLRQLCLGIIRAAAIYASCGTWSWVKVPLAWYAPFGVLFVLVAVGIVRRFRSAFLRSGEAAVLIPLIPLMAGFLWHMVFWIRLVGSSITSGYYLHVVWPFMALLVGGALLQLRRFWTRALLAALCVGCFVTARVGDLAQLFIYSGVATKNPTGFIAFPDGTGPTTLTKAFHNLGELVPLNAGFPFYLLGVVAQLTVVILLDRWLLAGGTRAGKSLS